MATLEDLGGLIDAFHEAALEPTLWQPALTRLGEALGGSGVIVLSAYDPDCGGQLFESIGYDPEYWERVQAEHSTPETNRYISLINSAMPGEVLQPRACMSLDDWLSDPIHLKFLRPDGLRDGLTCPLFHKEGGFAAIATFRSSLYAPEHLEILRAAVPHLRHALKVHLRLNSGGDPETGLSALDHLRIGALLADAQGRMVWVNSAGKRILEASDGLSVGARGSLAAGRPDETNRLRHLIRLAAEHALRSGRQGAGESAHPVAGGLIRLSRASGASPLELVVAPLRKPIYCRTDAIPKQASALIFVSDPEEGVVIEGLALRQMYGLTAAEANLTAKLVSGLDLPSAATAMGVSINTARTLLKRSFERTGTNRQSDLIGKVLRSPLGSVDHRH